MTPRQHTFITRLMFVGFVAMAVMNAIGTGQRDTAIRERDDAVLVKNTAMNICKAMQLPPAS